MFWLLFFFFQIVSTGGSLNGNQFFWGDETWCYKIYGQIWWILLNGALIWGGRSYNDPFANYVGLLYHLLYGCDEFQIFLEPRIALNSWSSKHANHRKVFGMYKIWDIPMWGGCKKSHTEGAWNDVFPISTSISTGTKSRCHLVTKMFQLLRLLRFNGAVLAILEKSNPSETIRMHQNRNRTRQES